jgi:hypothetical protein
MSSSLSTMMTLSKACCKTLGTICQTVGRGAGASTGRVRHRCTHSDHHRSRGHVGPGRPRGQWACVPGAWRAALLSWALATLPAAGYTRLVCRTAPSPETKPARREVRADQQLTRSIGLPGEELSGLDPVRVPNDHRTLGADRGQEPRCGSPRGVWTPGCAQGLAKRSRSELDPPQFAGRRQRKPAYGCAALAAPRRRSREYGRSSTLSPRLV